MTKKERILVGIPAFNEGPAIGEVVSDVLAEGFDVVVVDDGSKDETGAVAEKAGAIVLRHVINRGAGAATMTALEYAKREDYDAICFIDADGQHAPSDIKRLLKHKDKHHVVIGSRMLESTKDMPIQRRVAQYVGSLATYFFFGAFVTDSQSGFKVFSRDAIQKVDLKFDRFEFCSEIIGQIVTHKLAVVEVPIKLIYTEYSMGKAHGQSIFNGFFMLWRFFLR